MKLIKFFLVSYFFISCAIAQEKTDRLYPTANFDYQSVQKRIDQLSQVKNLDNYQLAKAQAWLNSSKYETWRNDSGWWPKEAFNEAQRVVTALEGRDKVSLNTKNFFKLDHSINREMLLAIESGFKKQKNCSKVLVARAEVELVHAAYETQNTSWGDGAPQLSLVKSLLLRAKDC